MTLSNTYSNFTAPLAGLELAENILHVVSVPRLSTQFIYSSQSVTMTLHKIFVYGFYKYNTDVVVYRTVELRPFMFYIGSTK